MVVACAADGKGGPPPLHPRPGACAPWNPKMMQSQGERKLRGLLGAGAAVRLISPAATPDLRALANSGAITWHARPYQPGDVSGARLVFAATDQRAVNAQVADDAAALGVLCNVADDPRAGDFHLPAVYREPGLLVAVSTAGASPARAKRLRDQIAAWLADCRL